MFIIAYTNPDGCVHAYMQHSAQAAAADVRVIEDDQDAYGLGVQTSTFHDMGNLVLALGEVPFNLQITPDWAAGIAGPASHGMFDLGVTAPWLVYVDHDHPGWQLINEAAISLDIPVKAA